MRLLGVDYGAKKIGLAISDEGKSIAFPSTVIKNDKHLLRTLKDIVERENIEKIIIGESRDYKQKKNLIMKNILKLKDIIEKEMGLSVILEPEFLTSLQARKIQGKNKMIDASAAAIILQSYIDKRTSNQK